MGKRVGKDVRRSLSRFYHDSSVFDRKLTSYEIESIVLIVSLLPEFEQRIEIERIKRENQL